MSYVEPILPLFLLLGLIGLIRLWRNPVNGRTRLMLTSSVVGILIFSMNTFAWIFSLPLEMGYDHDNPVPHETPQAIVILAGSVNTPLPERPYSYVGQDTYVRLQHGVWLFRHWNSSLPVLVCGGSPDGQEPYSRAMRRVLEAEGVPAKWIWTEDRSRSTHENAIYGAQILREHGVSRIALVVEASSMPRAAASFEKAGIAVVPAPLRFTHLDWEFSDIVPNWRAVALNGETVHEFIGLLWYRLRGWI